MMEYPAEKVDLIREQVEEFLGIISQLIVPADTGEKIGRMVTELEGELEKENPDIQIVRDIVDSMNAVIKGTLRPTLH